jgi:tetratricopeptide (TPR) repeat protein
MRIALLKNLFLAIGASFSLVALSAASSSMLMPQSNSQQDKLLDEGKRILLQGHPDTAIARYFEPIIQDYERQFVKDPRAIFSSHGMVESLIYSAAAGEAEKQAGSPRGSLVVGGEWTDALVLKAYALVELKRTDEAIATLQRATTLSSQFPLPWIELGAIRQEQKDWPATLEAYQHAEDATTFLDDGPFKHQMQARAWRGKGFVYTEQGKLDDSESLYKKCLTLDPDDGIAKRELDYINHLRAQSRPADAPAPATP